ncbi:beta-1,3-galactosyltransferase 1 isoform X1 [Octopus bimaculoides]|uniref:Hexosyltransferase n=1 Tax=Octopus bimaculoides TaxID=37653 RepID=A0A0L8GCD9_OCTBM|nr:beta-1,3-galactosyltransferase 1 isoform X1 [Octopus bimaculoides]XP_052834510.1 beta-1,3-galactosyltransferase 1 isoform X1 [Octopus bimaculoides]XP_052834515.1 beta-1,3-galactosyltransferase 1 isoform X1 [Octopus bimaculoides]|eukprot:XP_014782244.1 PREDICTED: beta-1,3-galactosyltransferase 1-like [Octopus bimaculoides]
MLLCRRKINRTFSRFLIFLAFFILFVQIHLSSRTKQVMKPAMFSWFSWKDLQEFERNNVKNNTIGNKSTMNININKKSKDNSSVHVLSLRVHGGLQSKQNEIMKVRNSLRNSSSLSLLSEEELPYYSRHIINPSLQCAPDDFMIVYIHTAPTNIKRRSAIRKTWGDKKLLGKLKIKLLFVMGVVKNRHVMDMVKLESDRYNDILQSEFNDTYRNLNSKAMVALRWIATNCHNISYIMKTDDDILVDIFQVVKHLRYLQQYKYAREKLILCNVWNSMQIIRDKNSKWYVSREEYPNNTYEVYCSGSAYIFSPDMPVRLLKISLKVPRFWIDDVYVTGMLVNALGIKHTNYDSAYNFLVSSLDDISKDNKRTTVIYHIPNTEIFYKLWNILNERMNHSGATRNILK